MTVQFNLFGGTVLKLGTDRHHGKFLDQIDTVEQIGCFGLTELVTPHAGTAGHRQHGRQQCTRFMPALWFGSC